MIRVLIADDQPLLRKGFRLILRDEPDIEVIGEADDGAQAVQLAKELLPDVVLMDLRMPGMDGVEATRILTEFTPDIHIVVLTMFDLDEYVFASLRAGASAFLLKDAKEDQLLSAIRVAADGGSLFAPSVTRRLIDRFATTSTMAPGAALAGVTDREREVLELIARGLTNAEIAQKLFISEHTAKSHVASILQKLNLASRVHAVVFAYESGLVRAGE